MTQDGQFAVIGLHDADALRAGDRGEKAEVGVFVAYRDGEYTIGVTDGDAGGGEFVQRFTTFSASGTATGAWRASSSSTAVLTQRDCASDPADVSTADGCMTLTVNGRTTAGTVVSRPSTSRTRVCASQAFRRTRTPEGSRQGPRRPRPRPPGANVETQLRCHRRSSARCSAAERSVAFPRHRGGRRGARRGRQPSPDFLGLSRRQPRLERPRPATRRIGPTRR